MSEATIRGTEQGTGDESTPSGNAVLQTVPLGMHWPTLDPFLFCAHHHDDYPAGDDRLAPRASLAGREIGADFAGVDGWNMYHGDVVPGFPQHPHRGFETVTFVRHGFIDHSDSLGATARFGAGDTQWLTAGRGIVHCEMFPLLDPERPNPLELFQIWLNLPAADKLVDPYFTMFWDRDVPHLDHLDGDGRVTRITVIAGQIDGHRPPPPPPDSWAARPEADVAIWHASLGADASWTLPTTGGETARTLYFYEGEALTVDGMALGPATGAVLDAEAAVTLQAGPGGAEVLILQGRPIAEPVAQYGPFVMNDEAGIRQTIADYQRTGFGGWPWPSDGPVHHRDQGRFARHPDGKVELIDDPVGT